ncbi:hypothetical protein QBC43DRAFT_349331 [Cladorrhinum sp. PSN259]|nr:hypothetical protein QBC43DRAFT_349331 [Cladorrhinum sp. PSN259]
MANDTRPNSSLRPRGLFAFAFLFARILVILALCALAGFIVHFIISILRAKLGGIPGELIALIVLTSAALLWSGITWNGYTRRLVHYAVTYSIDIILLIPFVALSVILAQPITQAKCATVPETVTNFTITAPSNTDFGKITLPGNGRVACQKIFAVWILLIIVAVMFIISAASAQIIHLRERKNGNWKAYQFKDGFSSDPSNVPGNEFFTQKPAAAAVAAPAAPGREYRQSRNIPVPKTQWDSFGDPINDEKKPREPHNHPMGSFGRNSFLSRKEEDGFSSWSFGSPAPSSAVLREFKPRRSGPEHYAAGNLNQLPTEAKVYQGSRNFRRSSGVAMISNNNNNTRPRSRQRGLFDDPRLNTPPRGIYNPS